MGPQYLSTLIIFSKELQCEITSCTFEIASSISQGETNITSWPIIRTQRYCHSSSMQIPKQNTSHITSSQLVSSLRLTTKNVSTRHPLLDERLCIIYEHLLQIFNLLERANIQASYKFIYQHVPNFVWLFEFYVGKQIMNLCEFKVQPILCNPQANMYRHSNEPWVYHHYNER